jgi:hypothetical protein
VGWTRKIQRRPVTRFLATRILFTQPTERTTPMQRDDVWTICKQFAPPFGIDPLLALALCEQESNYSETAIRLEQGYLRYVRTFSPLIQALFSTSWGLTQMMGDSLNQVGFYHWHFDTQTNDHEHSMLVMPMSEMSVAYALNEYLLNPDWQVQWGLKFFNDVKHQDLLKWNGGGDPQYPAKVLARKATLTKIYGGTQ